MSTTREDHTDNQGRVRKPKKPEIQIYRPGALRQRRSANPDDSTAQDQARSEQPRPDQTRAVQTRPDGEETRSNERNYNEKRRQGTARERREDYEEWDGREKRWPKESEKRHQKKGRERVGGSQVKEDYVRERIIYRTRPQEDQYESSPGNSLTTKNVGYGDQNADNSEYKSSNKVQERRASKEKSVSKSPSVYVAKDKNVAPTSVNAENNRYDTKWKLEGEDQANARIEKNASFRGNRQTPDRRTPKKDKRKPGKDKEQVERSDSLSSKKNSRAHSSRPKGYRGGLEYMEWTIQDDYSREGKQDGSKTSENVEYATHQRLTQRKIEEADKVNHKERTEEKRLDNQTRPKEDESRGTAWPTKHSAKNKHQEESVKPNKAHTENLDYHQQRKPGSRSNRQAFQSENKQASFVRSHDASDYGYCNESNKKREGQMSVTELAARVDQLVVGKPKGKAGGPKKKGKGWQESVIENKKYIHDEMTRGTWLEVEGEEEGKTVVSHPEPPDKNRGDMGRREVREAQEPTEKASRAKSYSGSREIRRKMGGNGKPVNRQQGRNKREDMKIDVTVNKSGQERVVTLARQRAESETEDAGTGRGRTSSGRTAEDLSSIPQKNVTSTHGSRNKFGSQDGFWAAPEKKQSSGGRAGESEETESMNVEEEDWGREVDQDLTWCNQEGPGRTPTWEDEKQSWRARKGKPHSESEGTHRRVESPGHRGGLIQMPMSMSRPDPPTPESTTSHSANSSTPVPQKLLYNPNNPSKPVAVVPSARDLPVSREAPRDAGRSESGGGAGAGTSLSAFMQSGQTSEYALEGHSPKVDPSILYSIQKGEMDINYYISSNQLPVEFRRIMDIRHHLQGCYRQLLTSDIRLCQERNVEASLWKTLYYVIIEKLREYIGRDPSLKERSLATLLMLVEEGQRYLQEVLEALQREYGFTLEGPPEEDAPGGTSNHTELRGRSKLALISAQKLLLSLGDLARYREQYNLTPNYALARKWYQMALQVHPRNGRPFNQLAIIAVNQKRPLDVVYFYVRSLTASNPFMSARDSLVSMFDDMRKKYLSQQCSESSPVEGTMLGVQSSMQGATSRGGGGGEGLRQELWIRPDSGATNRRTLARAAQLEEDDEEDDELRKMPQDQLMKRFLTSYLHCHGMLFSRVGLDGFRECCTLMLREFRALLLSGSPTSSTPGPIPSRLSTQHLLQVMAVNMYAVANTEVKDARVGSGYRSAAQDLALVLAQEMFGCVVRVVVQLLPRHLHHHPHPHHHHHHHSPTNQEDATPVAGDPQRLFSPTLAHFMPPLKAWCDWLLYHSAVWNPPTPAHEYTRAGGGDAWESIGELATILQGLGPPDVPLTEVAATTGGGEVAANMVPLRLTEDTFLRGYEPLLPAHALITHAPHTAHTGRACDWARVERVRTCVCQFLCGVEPPVLLLKKTERGDVLVPVVDTSPPDSPSAPRLSFSGSDVEVESESESEDSEVEEEMECEVEGDSPLASTVRLLTKRKKALERKHRQQRKLQTLLEGNVTLEMEVRPRYLVPDTNCFIEHLNVVQALVSAASYTVMVPLVVLNELDGLSRDAAVAKYGSVGHAVRVREGAAAALHYLRVTKPPSLKCVTSQGSVLSSTTFTAEIDVPDATNDDKILSCCVHFCSDSTQRRPIRAGVRRLYREVVLLTEDRNLRVKAHARDVPVRDLLDFARWAGVG